VQTVTRPARRPGRGSPGRAGGSPATGGRRSPCVVPIGAPGPHPGDDPHRPTHRG